MNICFLFYTNALAGGNYIIYKHARYLAENGHIVSIIFENYELANEGLFDTSKIKIHKSIKSALNEKYDLAFATFWVTAFSVLDLNSEKYAYFVQSDERRFNDEHVSEIERANRKLVEYTYKYFPGAIVTIANWIVRMFANEFDRKAYYLPNGLDTDLFNTDVASLAAKNSDKLRILVEGPGEVSFKRMEFTYACLNRYSKNFEIWHIANDNLVRPYWKIDRKFNRQKYVDMPRIMSSCDLLVKLSSVEGFFGPPLEMFGVGGTALTSDVSGYDEYIKDDINAIVAKTDSYDSVCEKLEYLLSLSPVKIKELKKNAINCSLMHSWKNKEAEILNAINWAYSYSELSGDRVVLKSIGNEYKNNAIELLKRCMK